MMGPRSVSPGRARALRTSSTPAELRLWYFIRKRQLESVRFRRQVPLGRYVVDFACLEERLVIELDGSQHGDQMAYDEARTAWLNEHGWRVLRFWNNEVADNIEGVLETIRAALRSVAGFPLPPLPRRRGRNEIGEGVH